MTPRALLDKPKLSWLEEYYYDFYRTLARSRQYFNIPQPILISEVAALFGLHNIYSYSERLWILTVVQELDLDFIDHYVNKEGSRPENSEGPSQEPGAKDTT